MSTGIFVVAMLIVLGGWWIPLAIWARRRAKHWHRFNVAHEAALREEAEREHQRRKARWAAAVVRWGSEEAAYRLLGDLYEDCPCSFCVSMWLMCEMADSPNPRHQELSKHMARHVFVLLVGVGLALGGCVEIVGLLIGPAASLVNEAVVNPPQATQPGGRQGIRRGAGRDVRHQDRDVQGWLTEEG